MDLKKIDFGKNTKDLLKELTKTPDNEKTFKSKKCFPYVETYYKPKTPISTKNFSPNFNPSETLARPSLSFKKIFKKIEFSPHVNIKSSIRSFSKQNDSFIKRCLEKSPEPCEFKSVIRIKPRLVKPLTRNSKIQSLNRSFNESQNQNQEYLRVNRLTAVNLKERRKVERVSAHLEGGKGGVSEEKEESEFLVCKSRLIHDYLNII